MALRLSGQTSIFGGVFCVFKSLLDIERQMKLEKNSFLTRKPGSHVRILQSHVCACHAFVVKHSKHLAPVVRKVDSAIHRINHYPAVSVVCFC